MKRIYLFLLLALLVVVSFFGLEIFIRKLMSETSLVLRNIREIEGYEYKINNEILKSAHFLYYPYDNIYQMLDKEEELINTLERDFLGEYPKSLEILRNLKKEIGEKRSAIEDFETLNSVIKNSLVYIPSLSLRYTETAQKIDPEYMELLHRVESYLLLSGRSFDLTFLEDIVSLTNEIAKKEFEDERLRSINDVLVKHLQTFVTYFPDFVYKFMYVTDESRISSLLEDLSKTFVEERKKRYAVVTYAHTGFSLLFASVLAYLAYLLVRVESQRRELFDLNLKLEKTLVTDDLTGLPNRRALYGELGGEREGCFILINIDGFKRINDVYGSPFGDSLLIEFARFLKNRLKDLTPNGRLFRVGADDFGIFLKIPSRDKALGLARSLVEEIEENTFFIRGVSLSLSVSAGISCSPPFLENADIAMKFVKRRREKIAVFEEEMKRSLEENLRVTLLLKEALAENRIVLHFQRVADTNGGQTFFYECLVRLKDKENGLLLPQSFLEVAKESKYYSRLTKAVILKAVKTFENKPFRFSVNLSADDIVDEDVKGFIYELLEENKGIANRMIFEILESESIENFGEVSEFIYRVRKLGAMIAIDDFGSGYSNFSYVTALKPDILKIDGSLIEYLPESEDVRLVVSTIADFCKKAKVKAVAEFVSNERIFSEVKRLGIPYCQGFYIGKPSEEIG